MAKYTSQIKIPTTAPAYTDKYFIRYGYSYKGVEGVTKSIFGSPQKNNSILPNCSGGAMGVDQMIWQGKGKLPSMNAENYYACGPRYGYNQVKDHNDACVSDYICYKKVSGGRILYGHIMTVASVTRQADRITSIVVAGSDYGGSRWYTKTLKPPFKWGTLTLQGFLHNKEIVDDMRIELPKPVERDMSKHQCQVVYKMMRLRSLPSLKGSVYDYCPTGVFDVLQMQQADGYVWYCIKENMWVAYLEGDVKDYPIETPEQKIAELEKEVQRLSQSLVVLQEEVKKSGVVIEEQTKQIEEQNANIKNAIACLEGSKS